MEMEALAKVAFVFLSCHTYDTALTTDGGIPPLTHPPTKPKASV
jgi:hypothetical protein